MEVLPGLELSGHTDTLSEANSLKDQKYEEAEIQTEQQNRNARDKFKKNIFLMF